MKVLSSGQAPGDVGDGQSGAVDESLTGNETVLVVEDDPMMRQLLTIALQRYGYLVIAARDGEAAIEVASKYGAPIHLVVSDVVMPRMNGVELATELRRWYPTIGLLLISGFPAGSSAALTLDADRSFFLEKPFSMHALAAATRSAIEWRPRHAP